ncbi:protein obstructor-E [Bombus vancouverensis nearcticus]|uniref:Protein obstructor-E-like n=1 Tax=Bombus bifarius TaxID=103933 RepID=A0A6P8N6G1_9HYME|nr:protein obstructor-E-like [Bombus vancouverensis nearcticus]XP_033185358.1 protein obstructor-E-like [Bombus vancouverensis nearcticus]XP_033316084.1 protein obstructor-E-like [Bombus bifarius]XP_033316085.1 protein obstructor-E-like [Bombus bifarius]
MTITTTTVRLLIACGVLGFASSASVHKDSCPEKNGRFSVPSQCDAYIECIDGIPEHKLCPEGLLFNPNVRFAYPCEYPAGVNCDGRPNRQTPQPTDDCPHQYGFFKIGDQQNCGKFMSCVEGRAHVFHCPEGLAFNSESYRCDWPDQVPDCDVESFLGLRCPSDPNDENRLYKFEFYASPYDCQRYFVCVNGRPRLQVCEEGKAFSQLENTCLPAHNVSGCEPLGLPHEKKKVPLIGTVIEGGS